MCQEIRATPLSDRELTRPTGDGVPPRPQPIKVWKFGGSSVADRTRLDAVARRMVEEHHHGSRVVAVLSAMGGSTATLSDLAWGVTDRPSPRELDALLSVGESVSCALAAMAVQELGVPAVSLNAAQVGIVTDNAHANARLRDVRTERIVSELDAGSIVLVAGFQGVSEDGDTTTLGRGGSDATAVAIAAALDAGQCEIFTDVDGVCTAHPGVVPEARPLDCLRHEEMLELAEGGAGVLQPRAVELAAAYGIDVHLRSSFTGRDGTWVRREPPTFETVDVAGVAHRDREPLFTVSGLSAGTVAATLAGRGASLGAIRPGRRRVQFTAPGTDGPEIAAAVRAAGGELEGEEDLGSVSVVSTGLGRKPEITARVLGTLEDEGIEPRWVVTTPARVCVHIKTDRVPDAVRLLHEAFVENNAVRHASVEGQPVPRQEVR